VTRYPGEEVCPLRREALHFDTFIDSRFSRRKV